MAGNPTITTSLVDGTATVRAGETIDRARLDAFLRSHLPVEGALELEQFPGGHSNLTYLARYGAREFVVRRPPHGTQVKGAHDMGREYRVLSKLHAHYAPAPKPLAWCDDATIIGAPFYVMERKRGVVFRVRKPEELQLTPQLARGITTAFIDGLAQLHSLDFRAVGLDELYKGPGYVERQVRGWAARWENAKTEELPEMERAREWLIANLPEDSAASVIHNDYKFDNLMFDAADLTRLVGVLDWEMATVGDPLADLAVCLTSYGEPGGDQHSTVGQCFMVNEPGALRRDELAERYAAQMGRDLRNMRYYYALAHYKGAVTIQQIYYRYHHGHTKDERFARFDQITKSLARRAVAMIDG